MIKKHINKIAWVVALIGWVLYVLDDTLSKLVYEFTRDGLTVDRIIQLSQIGSVVFMATRVEKVVQKFRIHKLETVKENSEVIGKLTSRVHSQNKELGKNGEAIKNNEIKIKGQEARLESIWEMLLSIIWFVSEAYTEPQKQQKK